MRKYRINRNHFDTGGGIYQDGKRVDAIKGILMYHSPETTAALFERASDTWITLSFIDLTNPQDIDWGFTLLNNGKSRALEQFTEYLYTSEPFNHVMCLSLEETNNRDFSKKWCKYKIEPEPFEGRVLELLEKATERNCNMVLPLIDPDPKVRPYFPEPPSLNSLISRLRERDLKRGRLVQEINLPNEIQPAESNEYLRGRMGGVVWD